MRAGRDRSVAPDGTIRISASARIAPVWICPISIRLVVDVIPREVGAANLLPRKEP